MSPMPALEPLVVTVKVADAETFRELCKGFQRFVDEVEGVEQFLRLKATKERLTCADQLRSARRDFQSMLDEVA